MLFRTTTKMGRILFVSLLLSALAVYSVKADEPEKIISGTNAAPGEFPYTASLRMYGNHFCGGAIIDKYFILTAAHCLAPFNPEKVVVVTGTNLLSSGGEGHRVARFFIHPQFKLNHNWYYDIGLIKLATPIKFNALQRSVKLPTADPPRNIRAIVSAWGKTAPPPHGRGSDSLQKLLLNVLSTASCQSHHQARIQNSMICTLNKVNVGTCSGDSGSPLVYKDEIIGVVSGGIPCARGVPDIFTNVFSYLPYIRKCMQQ